MQNLKIIGMALVMSATATAAMAADLPARNYTKAPPMVAAYNWTGFYAGLNAGYGWSGSDDGFVGGGQIGYNWQGVGSPFVFGLEADFQGTSIKSTSTAGVLTGEAKIPAFGTVRGRVGYAWDRAMLYATGGWAYTKTEASVTGGGLSTSDSKWGSGYALGGGLEYAFSGPWSAKLEYLYVNAKSVDLTLAGVPFSTGDYHYNIVRAGLNYRF